MYFYDIKNDFLYVLGRKKNILIGDNGKNIAPEELIRKIVKYNGVNDCNIVMRDNKLHAIINSDLSQENIKNIIDGVNKKLPNYSYKEIVEFKVFYPINCDYGFVGLVDGKYRGLLNSNGYPLKYGDEVIASIRSISEKGIKLNFIPCN